jgi:predicted secreted protein
MSMEAIFNRGHRVRKQWTNRVIQSAAKNLGRAMAIDRHLAAEILRCALNDR